MSDTIPKAVELLRSKMGDSGFSGSAKFVIEGEGAIIIDGDGVRAGDDDADVTLTASQETFQGILDGSENATAAFMSGKLTVDGDMGQAMALAGALA